MGQSAIGARERGDDSPRINPGACTGFQPTGALWAGSSTGPIYGTTVRVLRRAGLERALDLLRESDTLVVWKLDRLGRSVKDLVELVGDLEKRGVHFRSVTDASDTSTPAGRFLFHVMASLAQMERELLLERTRAGLDAAKAKGRVGGRKAKMTPSKVEAARKLLSAGVHPGEVAANLGVSLPTLYRWIPAKEKTNSPTATR
jgi:DNA invertase Pin-like site-specific DNA recombinase